VKTYGEVIMKTKRGYTIQVTTCMLDTFEKAASYEGSRRHDESDWCRGLYYKHRLVNDVFKVFLEGCSYILDNNRFAR